MLRSRIFFYLGLPGGGGGVQGKFSEILLCKFKKSRTAHLMSEPYTCILGYVVFCFFKDVACFSYCKYT